MGKAFFNWQCNIDILLHCLFKEQSEINVMGHDASQHFSLRLDRSTLIDPVDLSGNFH